jgi:hypothetical protein
MKKTRKKSKTVEAYYDRPAIYVPTREEIEQAAKFINFRLTEKRVISVNGIPVDENGNVMDEK